MLPLQLQPQRTAVVGRQGYAAHDIVASPMGHRGAQPASAQTDLARLQLPAHQRLGPRRRVSALDAEGWQRVLPLEEVQRPAQQPQRQGVVAGSDYAGARRPLPAVL